MSDHPLSIDLTPVEYLVDLTCVFARDIPPTHTLSIGTNYAKHHRNQLDGDIGTVGITDFAQNSLGDVVYVDLPEVGDRFDGEEAFGSVESVKAASDVYTPIAGEVTEVNENLGDNPGLVNESPQDEGWFIKIKVDDVDAVSSLLDEAAYQDLCDSESH